MSDRAFLDWPFFDAQHREVLEWADQWCAANPAGDHADVDAACRALVRSLGASPLLQMLAPHSPLGYPVRSIALVRERLAQHSGLADFAFAMQGLGLGPVVDRGSDEQKLEWGPRVARGEAICAFALTEPETGSDAASIAMRAERTGNGWVLDGEKSYISNGPIADLLTVFARTGGSGHDAISAFLVRGDAPGLEVAERIEVVAPHPLARLRFDRVPAELIGQAGEGFAIAMRTLTRFRVSVGAAALGFARRALRGDRFRFAATARRWQARRQCRHPGKPRRDGNGDRRIRASDRARRLAAGQRRRRPAAQRRYGQAARDRAGAARDRHGGPAARRHGRDPRRPGRGALPRDPCPSNLRRRKRGPAPDHRPRPAQGAAAMKVLQPPGWPRPKGYSNGISASGRMIFTAGVVGWDEGQNFYSADMVEQFAQALKNIVAILAEDGARPEHIVRMTVYVVGIEGYRNSLGDIGAVWKAVIGNHFPAMALVEVKSLVEPAAVVEIEATAVVPD
jgi:alkylation response protein AidB-like acyl-CoA dehydrogenase/enamine deaminase RidA (YjgF/YER057c/UK114 family)